MPDNPAAVVPEGGGWRLGLPPCPAFSLLCCPQPPAALAIPAFSLLFSPIPPAPLPLRGRGSPKVYFAGGFAPGTPALNPGGTCRPCHCGVRRGGLPSLSPAHPAVCLLFCPHPPAPLPLRGRGRILLYFAGGYRPRHPCTEPGRHLQTLPLWCLKGSLPPAALARPAFSLLFSPIPPAPLPGGKGDFFCFLMQGASPLASPSLNPRGTYRICQAGA